MGETALAITGLALAAASTGVGIQQGVAASDRASEAKKKEEKRLAQIKKEKEFGAKKEKANQLRDFAAAKQRKKQLSSVGIDIDGGGLLGNVSSGKSILGV